MTKSIIVSSNLKGSESKLPVVIASTPLHDLDIVAQLISPSRKLRAVLRNVKFGDSGTTRLVEIWKNNLLVVSANVTECHGDFYADG